MIKRHTSCKHGHFLEGECKECYPKVGCYDCGLPYGEEGWIEAIIPDKVWDFISPTGDQGGILCINCISKRLAKYGFRRIPVWLCGMEPIVAKEGDEDLQILRNWEPKLLKRIKRERRAK